MWPSRNGSTRTTTEPVGTQPCAPLKNGPMPPAPAATETARSRSTPATPTRRPRTQLVVLSAEELASKKRVDPVSDREHLDGIESFKADLWKVVAKHSPSLLDAGAWYAELAATVDRLVEPAPPAMEGNSDG